MLVKCSNGHEADESEFGADKTRKNGRNAYCRPCNNARRRARYAGEHSEPVTPSSVGKAEHSSARAKLQELEGRHQPPTVPYRHVEPVFGSKPVLPEPRWWCPVGACSVENKS